MKFFKKSIQPSRVYESSSEFVSSGHPDRLADNLAAIVIQDIQAKDGAASHAAIEVFLTHDSVIFGGEATTSLDIDSTYLKNVVRKGFNRVGYIPEIRNYWNKSECALPGNLRILNKIAAQSVDIARGTTDLGVNSGWNDQGVYFSSSESTNPSMLGSAHYAAQCIGEMLQSISKQSILDGGTTTSDVILGPDNKCVVTFRVKEDGVTPIEISAITIAAAHAASSPIERVRAFVKSVVTTLLLDLSFKLADDVKWIINGTGRFVIHGPVSDCSMTGRKISVNHPSAGPVWSNKMIGGGSLVKPAHASDLMLNVMARFIANVVVRAGLTKHAVVGCAGAIGVKGLQSLFIKGDSNFDKQDNAKVCQFFKDTIEWSPIAIAQQFNFFDKSFDFGEVVNSNFFGHGDIQPWDNDVAVTMKAKELISYLS